MKFVLKLLLIAVAVAYAGAAAFMYVAQRSFLYFPDPRRTAPEAAGLPQVEEREIKTPDGETIIAWYGKAKPGQPTLLYFHGNGGAIELRNERIKKYMRLGRGMYMMSYRGFSGSTGQPTEAHNVADAKLAYEDLLKQGVKPADIILYGESLGTGVAIQVALEKKVSGIVLDSPYTSVAARAQQLFPWLPVSLLIKDRYDSLNYIGNFHAPLLIMHGDRDEVIPVAMGKELFAAANEPKELAIIKGGGHEDHYKFGSYERINSWIDRLRAGAIRLPQ